MVHVADVVGASCRTKEMRERQKREKEIVSKFLSTMNKQCQGNNEKIHVTQKELTLSHQMHPLSDQPSKWSFD